MSMSDCPSCWQTPCACGAMEPFEEPPPDRMGRPTREPLSEEGKQEIARLTKYMRKIQDAERDEHSASPPPSTINMQASEREPFSALQAIIDYPVTEDNIEALCMKRIAIDAMCAAPPAVQAPPGWKLVPDKPVAWKYRTMAGEPEWRVTLNEQWARSINGESCVIQLYGDAAPQGDEK
jgi:hypothetical protein